MSKKIVCMPNSNSKITFTFEYPFFLKSVDGLHSLKGNVSTSKNAFSVGEKYLGTSIPKRNIIIQGEMFNNFFQNRQTLYKNFPLDSEGTLFYYEDNVSRKIQYRVEDIDIEDKGIPRKFTISLICLNPYFTDIDETKVSMANWTKGLEFPLEIPEDGIEFGYKNTNTMATIENDTNIEIGMKVIFTASDNVKNPTLININTQEKLIIEKDMEAGDTITVTTYINNKNIILKHNGNDTNINNYLKFGTKFLQIHKGTNIFKSTADSGADNLTTEIYYLINYEAV